MARILNLIEEPHPLLHEKSSAVDAVMAKERDLFDNMIATMRHNNGIGLAAIQVGIKKCMLIIDHDYIIKRENIDKKPIGKMLCMANPRIIKASKEEDSQSEGCLSFPGVYQDILRPAKIIVRYIDYNNTEGEIAASGLLSACLQHEIDHTNGIVFLDHLSTLKRSKLIKKLAKLRKANGAL